MYYHVVILKRPLMHVQPFRAKKSGFPFLIRTNCFLFLIRGEFMSKNSFPLSTSCILPFNNYAFYCAFICCYENHHSVRK